MVHDEHKPFGDDYDYRSDPEGLVYWKKGRVAPGTDTKCCIVGIQNNFLYHAKNELLVACLTH